MRKKILTFILSVTFSFNFLFAQTWESFTTENSGLPDNMVNSITIGNDGTIWFATNNGLASYKDNIWKSYNTDNGLSNNKLNSLSFLPLNSQNLWIASNLGVNIFNINSANDITDPQFITRAINNIVSDTVNVVELDGFSNNWIGTDKGLSIITNSGNYNFTQQNGLEASKVNALKSLNSNWVHVGTAGGGVSRLKYNGVDGITSASIIENNWSGLPSDTVLTVYVTDDTLYWYGTTAGAATFHGENSKVILDANNNPINWWIYNTFTSSIIDNYIRAIIRDNNNNMWFGTKKGLSKLSYNKSTWQSFTEDDGLISNNIFDIKVDSDNNLWIATDKGVSYLSDFPSSVHNEQVIGNEISLTNYPNPFNPETNIDYTVPKAGKVRLEVFNNLGQLVKILVDREQSSGRYQVLFNTKNIPSGIYFYRLTTGQLSIAKKMVLLK